MLFRLKNKYIPSSLLVISYLCLLLPLQASASAISIVSDGMLIKVNQVFKDLGIPWGMTFLSKNTLLVTERSGSILFVDLKNNTKRKLNNTPVVLTDGQGGMLDVVLSPNYKTDGWIYFTYVKNINNEGATILARAKLKKYTFYAWQELLVSNSRTTTSHHFGSRIAFDDNGHVFFSIGDRGERPNAQNLLNHAGSIIRLNLDGSIPKDNPFVNNKKALPEIWSYGHRNPQGLAYDFNTNNLWEIEHGPRGGDEINLIKSAANYGWPIISYGKEYWGPIAVGEGTHRNGMQQPIKIYDPSIAPGSLLLYSGNVFPKWKGNLFAGALKLRHINRIVLNNKNEAIREERLFESLNERIRAISQSPDGLIYFSTDDGNLYQITPHIP